MGEPVAAAQNVLEYLNTVGSVGLALIVWALMSGRLITRREFDREVERSSKLDERLERALHIGDRAMDASDKLANRLPAKN